MPQYEIDYWNTSDQIRTKIVEAANETLIPFELHKLDKHLKKVKRVKVLEAKPAVNP
jgi:hypothetical protein